MSTRHQIKVKTWLIFVCSQKKRGLHCCLTTNEAFSSECAHFRLLSAATCSFVAVEAPVCHLHELKVSLRNNDRSTEIEIQLRDILLNSFGVIESICIWSVWDDYPWDSLSPNNASIYAKVISWCEALSSLRLSTSRSDGDLIPYVMWVQRHYFSVRSSNKLAYCLH